ncbi:MAG: SDR family NAD(P)-dependent oxidoreductase [Leptolyngbya sp. BL-A-14]
MNSSKVAAVLGVGPGLGAAIAHRFAQENFAVALMARNTDKLATIQADIEAAGARALSVVVDATDPAAVQAAFALVRSLRCLKAATTVSVSRLEIVTITN